MAERKEVIRGLEACQVEKDGCTTLCKANGCPYNVSSTHCMTNLHKDALAMLNGQEARVLTLEEVIHSKDWIWYQWKNTHCGWSIAVNCDGKWIEWEDSTTDQLCKYGKKWRCWTSRPSPEQMRDTKWEAEEQ